MEFTFEDYSNRKHFQMVTAWWSAHRLAPIDIDCLSDRGLIAYLGGIPIAASWLYLPNSRVANIGWMVTNPVATMITRGRAVKEMIEAQQRIAKEEGYTRAITFCSSAGLSRAFESAGFHKLVDHEVLIKPL